MYFDAVMEFYGAMLENRNRRTKIGKDRSGLKEDVHTNTCPVKHPTISSN